MNRTDQYNDQVEDPEYGPEFVVLRNGELEVRTDPFPKPISYVRVVQVLPPTARYGCRVEELTYWNNEELGKDFTEADPAEEGGAAGAMLAAIGCVARGELP